MKKILSVILCAAMLAVMASTFPAVPAVAEEEAWSCMICGARNNGGTACESCGAEKGSWICYLCGRYHSAQETDAQEEKAQTENAQTENAQAENAQAADAQEDPEIVCLTCGVPRFYSLYRYGMDFCYEGEYLTAYDFLSAAAEDGDETSLFCMADLFLADSLAWDAEQAALELNRVKAGIQALENHSPLTDVKIGMIDSKLAELYEAASAEEKIPGDLDPETLETGEILSELLHLQICPRCHGMGTTDCDDCKGTGWKSCAECAGAGYSSCRTCHGTGKVERSRSDADKSGAEAGSVEADETCPTCFGTGLTVCVSCVGMGETKCDTCGGLGYRWCAECQGLGYE